MLEEYDGRIRLIFKDLPLAMHTMARPAHEAARCAGAAGKYWPYHDRLFAAQPVFRRADLLLYAGELGLPSARGASTSAASRQTSSGTSPRPGRSGSPARPRFSSTAGS